MVQTTNDRTAKPTNPFEARDDDPASLVAARLRRSGYPFLYAVKCEFHDGISVLSGTVPTFHLKQIAQELAAHTPGIHAVENHVAVTGDLVAGRFAAEG